MSQRKATAVGLNGQPPAQLPAEWTEADVAAIQALQRGDATAHQQLLALTWIIEKAANTYDLEYRTDPRDHAFCSGRRFVGLQVVKMLKLSLTKIQGKTSTNR